MNANFLDRSTALWLHFQGQSNMNAKIVQEELQNDTCVSEIKTKQTRNKTQTKENKPLPLVGIARAGMARAWPSRECEPEHFVTYFHPIPSLHLDKVFQRQFRSLFLSDCHFFLILKFIIIARFCRMVGHFLFFTIGRPNRLQDRMLFSTLNNASAMQRLDDSSLAEREAKCTKSMGNSVKNILKLYFASSARVLSGWQHETASRPWLWWSLCLFKIWKGTGEETVPPPYTWLPTVDNMLNSGVWAEQWGQYMHQTSWTTQTEDTVSNQWTNQSEIHADCTAHANVECGINVSRVGNNVSKCRKKVKYWMKRKLIHLVRAEILAYLKHLIYSAAFNDPSHPNAGSRGSIQLEFYRGWCRTFCLNEDFISRKMKKQVECWYDKHLPT